MKCKSESPIGLTINARNGNNYVQAVHVTSGTINEFTLLSLTIILNQNAATLDVIVFTTVLGQTIFIDDVNLL